MLIQLEKVPLMCHQLKLKLKTPVSGKNSTFAKVGRSFMNGQIESNESLCIQVDTVICEARDLMNAVSRLCTNVFVHQANVSKPDWTGFRRTVWLCSTISWWIDRSIVRNIILGHLYRHRTGGIERRRSNETTGRRRNKIARCVPRPYNGQQATYRPTIIFEETRLLSTLFSRDRLWCDWSFCF